MLDRCLFKIIDAVNIWLGRYASQSYGQEGEDMILRTIFQGQKKGFYVDVGAHHPVRFSNTYYFYRQGWRGINLDARPGSMRLFKLLRSRDVNLELAVSDRKGYQTYYMFNDPALNGFSECLSLQRNELKGYRIVATKTIETYPLGELLGRHCPPNQKIDFLSVDVESMDLNVLRSNDWEKYRPKVVLVEILGLNLDQAKNHETCKFLEGQGYVLNAKTASVFFFMRND